MPKYRVDSNCMGCGTCTLVCPAKILVMESGLPVMPSQYESVCLKCGQCIAYCPAKANRLEGFEGTEVENAPRFNPAGAQNIIGLLKNRRSYRSFARGPVAREVTEKILEAANFYPSAVNARPVRWVVVDDPAKVRELSGLICDWFASLIGTDSPMAAKAEKLVSRYRGGDEFVFRGAPAAVFAVTPKVSAVWGETDAAIAATYFNLAAEAFDIGCTFAGYAVIAAKNSPEVQAYLGLSADEVVRCGLFYGKKTIHAVRIPQRPIVPATFL